MSHADGRAGRQEANSRFSQFCETRLKTKSLKRCACARFFFTPCLVDFRQSVNKKFRDVFYDETNGFKKKWDAPRDPNNYESRGEDSSKSFKRTETQGANFRDLRRFFSYFPFELLSIIL